MTPSGVGSPPSGGSGWLARLAVNSTLSWLTRAPSSDGVFPPRVRRKRDNTLVSSRKRPSPSPRMSPKASATTNVSSPLSAKRREGARGSPASAGSSLGKGGNPRSACPARGFGQDLRVEVGVAAQPPIEVDVLAGHHGR